LNFLPGLLKAVITCAGKGTRLLPFTKELPKEMAPIFSFTQNGIEVKPLIQQIFENLFTVGIREFCFISGKTKRSLQDHFYPDQQQDIPTSLSSFYDMIINSQIAWINQLIPKGFGDAVLASKSFIKNNVFLVQAGDVVLSSQIHSSVKKLIELSKNTDIEAGFLVQNVTDPDRHGIVTTKTDEDISRVTKVVEKPTSPETNLGIMPFYFFRSSIFDALETTTPGYGGEIQLTDAIQKLIESGKNVVAIKIDEEIVLDVGTPESYYSAINLSYNLSMKRLE
jgi:UTP--glucose-1-phosphate uridylyltransferase